MRALITSYRYGRTNQAVLQPEGIATSGAAATLIGRKAQWKFVPGSIISTHGAKGAVIAKFPFGLPGQAVGDSVEISEAKRTKTPKTKKKR